MTTTLEREILESYAGALSGFREMKRITLDSDFEHILNEEPIEQISLNGKVYFDDARLEDTLNRALSRITECLGAMGLSYETGPGTVICTSDSISVEARYRTRAMDFSTPAVNEAPVHEVGKEHKLEYAICVYKGASLIELLLMRGLQATLTTEFGFEKRDSSNILF